MLDFIGVGEVKLVDWRPGRGVEVHKEESASR